MFPKHATLQIDHNTHIVDGQDVETWLGDEHRIFGASFDAADFAQMVNNDEVWVIRWSVEAQPGEHAFAVYAATWERALELANAKSGTDRSSR